MPDKIKVFIVDDDPLMRQALAQYIHSYEDMTVVGEASEMKTALRAMSKLKPDIALIDILGFEGEEGGIQMIRGIKAERKELPLLAISSHDSTLFAVSALQAGANGYLMKQEASVKIGIVIRQIMNGEMYVSGAADEKLIRRHMKNSSSKTEANQYKLNLTPLSR